ncbi:MAG: hypothetical protein HZA52_13885 [Planctomycetes bacterium]|nr:hypothetical protein [Planctomycetota bacterium]
MKTVVVASLDGLAGACAGALAGARAHACAGVLAFALLCASCSQKSAQELGDAGNLALGRSDHGAAIVSFHEAAEFSTPGSAEFVAFRLSECEAWCGLDGARAATEFLSLAGNQPERVGVREYVSLIAKLSSRQHYEAATGVLEAGAKRFPDDPKLDELGHSLAQAAANAGNENAVGALKNLGYLGND